MRKRILENVFAVLTLAVPCFAQWAQQSFNLQSGWNSVYLEVDPAPAAPNALFASLPIESVWYWVQNPETVRPPGCDDPDDPACAPLPGQSWRVWLPNSNPGSVVNTLGLIRNGSYLIKTTAPTTLTVTGKPSGAATHWLGGFNLSGFHVVSSGTTPTFATYLSPSAAHAATQIFQVAANGSLASVPLATAILPGKSYWVSSGAEVDYDGPLAIDNTTLAGLNYGQSITDAYVSLNNLAGAARVVSITPHNSAAVPPNNPPFPSNPGAVPIDWLNYGSGGDANDVFTREPLPQAYNLPAAGSSGALSTVRLVTNRASLATATLITDVNDPQYPGSQYQGLLEITDGAGYRRIISAASQVPPRAGLWIGSVSVNKVSWVTADVNGDADTTTPRATPAPFSFPILVHQDATNAAKLLSEVTLMFRPGTDAPPVAGRYVLITPGATPAQLQGLIPGSTRDGTPHSPRYSTAAFSFDGDQALSGQLGTTLTASINIAGDHRLNPFRHRYHPDHDGLTPDGQPLPEERVEVTRAITLTFEAVPPTGVVAPGWGDTVLGGTYAETITGLHRDPIHTQGRFELRRVSQIGTLNGP